MTRASRAFPSGGPSPPFRAELHPLGGDTDEPPWMEAGDPLVHRNRTLEPLAAPWGEADDVSTRNNHRPGNLSSPNPTAHLVGAYREDTPSYE